MWTALNMLHVICAQGTLATAAFVLETVRGAVRSATFNSIIIIIVITFQSSVYCSPPCLPPSQTYCKSEQSFVSPCILIYCLYFSLNREKRQRELLRVTRENQEILKRINMRKPEYSVEQWAKDWEWNQKFMDNISAFPKDWWIQEVGCQV